MSLFDVPHVLGRIRHRKWVRKNRRIKGRSIEERPAIVSEGTEIGHWEVDTVVGKREGREAVTFTAVEKVTRNYIAIRIPGRNSAGVEPSMKSTLLIMFLDYISVQFQLAIYLSFVFACWVNIKLKYIDIWSILPHRGTRCGRQNEIFWLYIIQHAIIIIKIIFEVM